MPNKVKCPSRPCAHLGKVPKQSEIPKEKSKDCCVRCVVLCKSPSVAAPQGDGFMTYHLPMDRNIKVLHPSSSQCTLSRTHLATKGGIRGTGHRKWPTRESAYPLGLGGGFRYKNYLLGGAEFYWEEVPRYCIDRISFPNREVLLTPFKPTVIWEPASTDPRRT